MLSKLREAKVLRNRITLCKTCLAACAWQALPGQSIHD